MISLVHQCNICFCLTAVNMEDRVCRQLDLMLSTIEWCHANNSVFTVKVEACFARSWGSKAPWLLKHQVGQINGEPEALVPWKMKTAQKLRMKAVTRKPMQKDSTKQKLHFSVPSNGSSIDAREKALINKKNNQHVYLIVCRWLCDNWFPFHIINIIYFCMIAT